MEKKITYSLNWYGTKYKKEALAASVFSDAIYSFGEEEDFIILEPSAPIENSVFLQACAPVDDPDNRIQVEIRFEYGDNDFKQYQYFSSDREEVLNLFYDYWGNHKIPNISNWIDITEELK